MIAVGQIRRWRGLAVPWGYLTHPAEGKRFEVIGRGEEPGSWRMKYLDQMAVETCIIRDEFADRFTVLVEAPPLRESFAEVAHQIWSTWAADVCWKYGRRKDGRIVIPAAVVARWERQMNTPYRDLTEAEKESDRRQADKYLAALDPKFGVSWSES